MRALVLGVALMSVVNGCAASDARRLAQLEARVTELEAAATPPQVAEAPPAPHAPPAAPVAAVPPVPPSDTFAGWILNGPNVSNYSIVHDQDVKKSGAASARITCVIGDTGSFGGMMQSINAASYRGKRVRFSALVRTVDVVGWVGLWMRVDRSSQPSSAFDNMQDRGIRGTTEWTRHDVVLDVADDAESLHYGLLHAGGPGSTWLDGASLEIVDKKIDVTGKNMHPSPSARPMQPSNLDLDG